jgi:prophage DNA circulation protein
MRKLVIALVLGTSLLAMAKQETIAELQAKLEKAEPKKQPDLYMKLAHLQLEAANDIYNSNAAQARSLVEQSLDSADKATQASLQTGKHEKKTEISLRKLEDRLKDIIQSWNFDDRSAVKSGVQRIESLRGKLLDRMFKIK